jgi:hypothetical protein
MEFIILACVIWLVSMVSMHLLIYTDYQGLARKLHAIYIVLSFPTLSVALGYILIKKIPYEKKEERGLFIYLSVIILIYLAIIGHRVVPIIQDIWSGNELTKKGVTIVNVESDFNGGRGRNKKISFSDNPKTTYRYWEGDKLSEGEVVDARIMPISQEILEIKRK